MAGPEIDQIRGKRRLGQRGCVLGGAPGGGPGTRTGETGVREEITVATCRAAAGCPRAVSDVIGLRERCIATLEEMDAAGVIRAKVDGQLREHHRLKVVLSGCPNQCSQPQVADVGFVGQRFPVFEPGACIACGLCVDVCAESALRLADGRLFFDRGRCQGCGSCIAVCPTGAVGPGEQGWRVLVGGRLGRHPRLAAPVAACATPGQAVDVLSAVVRVYGEGALPEERVGAALDRLAGVSARVAAEDDREQLRQRALRGLLTHRPTDRPRVGNPGAGGS